MGQLLGFLEVGRQSPFRLAYIELLEQFLKALPVLAEVDGFRAVT